MTIKLMDCTLRDGGYINNWHFGASTIASIFDRLVSAGIDLIEVGFLNEHEVFNPERTIQPTTVCYNKIFDGIQKGASKTFAMIDYGTCSIDNISAHKEDDFLDGIRLIFKKPNMRPAIEFGKQILEKNYLLSLQMVSITDYNDRDILDFCDLVNQIKPYAVSMVDTYGLMHKDEMLHYFHLLDHNLTPEITIGYHSHNNFQLAYANTIEMIKKTSFRNLLIDGTVYGMGKSAGNAPLELLAMHLNEFYDKKYKIDQILEIIDVNIMRIYEKKKWGYSLPFFLAASNDCHPNYIQYFLQKRTLSIKTVNSILHMIEPSRKLLFDENYASLIYKRYQSEIAVQESNAESLKRLLNGKTLLLLGPGKTLKSQKEHIFRFISEAKPVVVSVNCVPEEYDLDFIFLGSAKRYDMLYRKLLNRKKHTKIIAVSNITSTSEQFDYVLNYGDLLDKQTLISDNALAMLLNFLVQVNIKQIALAGFDGFSANTSDNYYDEFMELSGDYRHLQAINHAIANKINLLRHCGNITFLTQSLYEMEV